MAAKNKPRRAADVSARGPDVQEVFGMQLRASQRRDELLEEARELQAAGKIRQARAVEKRAGQIQQLIGALEQENRPPGSAGPN
jgi:hypothetical protein